MSNAVTITDSTGTVGDTEAFKVVGRVGASNTLSRNKAASQTISGGACNIIVFEVKP